MSLKAWKIYCLNILIKKWSQKFKIFGKQAVIFHFEETVLGIEETANGIVLETSEQEISCDSGIFALNLHPQLAYLDKKFNGIWIRQSRWMLIYKLQCRMFCHR